MLSSYAVGQPSIRGAVERSMLGVSSQLPDELRAEFERRVPTELCERIRRAPLTAWLPIEEVIPLRRLLIEVAGEQQALAAIRGHMLEMSQEPVLKQLAETMIRLFSLDAKGLHRSYPRVWKAITRDAGELAGELLSDDELRITYTGGPTEAGYFDLILFMHRATLLGMLDYVKQPGKVHLQGDDPIVFHVRW